MTPVHTIFSKQNGGKRMNKKRLSPPNFDTPEEEDEFWQTHSPLDFEHENALVFPNHVGLFDYTRRGFVA